MLYFSKMNPTFPQRRKHQLFQYLVQYNTIICECDLGHGRSRISMTQVWQMNNTVKI